MNANAYRDHEDADAENGAGHACSIDACQCTILLTPVLALPALIYANQIPVHYGIIVDVAFPDAINATSVKTLEHVFAVGSCQTPIPGQLCAVENSGHGSPRHD
jgi:hypothetical protein